MAGTGVAWVLGNAMNKMTSAIVDAFSRDTGCELDRASARLALLIVVDRLDRVLTQDEKVELADAVPLAVSLLLRKPAGPEVAQNDLLDRTEVHAVCHVLATYVPGTGLARKLRDEAVWVLAGRELPPEELVVDRQSRPTVPALAAPVRQTVPAIPALRPTQRVSDEQLANDSRETLPAVRAA